MLFTVISRVGASLPGIFYYFCELILKPSPNLGFGLGLRTTHYEAILETKPDLDWLEVISENYLVPGGRPLANLTRIRQDYPMVMHGVSMSIGSSDALNFQYLHDLKQLAQRIEPAWISDHLCWTGIAGKNLHDLMPLPYTEEALARVAAACARCRIFSVARYCSKTFPVT